MTTKGLLVGDVQHLKEQAEIFDVIGIVVVVDVEPEDGVRFRIHIPDGARRSTTRDQDGGAKSSRAFGGDQSEVIVTVVIGIFQFVEIMNVVQAKLIQILLDIGGQKVRNVALVDASVAIRRNQIVGLTKAEEFSQTKRNLLWRL